MGGFLDKYKEKHGVIPDKIAFELWQTETVNHFGVVELKILYLLGAKPIWNERGEVTGVEVIPRAELGRPRVDTVLSIGGLYRDNLPEVMQVLQSAVDKVAAQAEEDNPVALNVERTVQTLLARGVEPGRAKRLARVRMFGNEFGVCGTKLAPATVASGIWDREGTLAETYLERMSFLYGPDPDTRNVKLDGVNLYAEALKEPKPRCCRGRAIPMERSTPIIHSNISAASASPCDISKGARPNFTSPTCATRARSRRNLSRNSSASNCVRACFIRVISKS